MFFMATKKTTTKKTSTKPKAKKPAAKKKAPKAAEPKQASSPALEWKKVQDVVAESTPKFAPVIAAKPKKKSLWKRITGFGF